MATVCRFPSAQVSNPQGSLLAWLCFSEALVALLAHVLGWFLGELLQSNSCGNELLHLHHCFNRAHVRMCSIEFDRDNELFATAGVSRRIKVFEFTMVVNEMADVHCPVVEMSTRSKLSCLSWNKYIKPHIASSDYEGIVTVWDINTCQSVMEYEEHEKRAWSVDFSRTEPTQLVSGSDDGKVKVWSTREENSVLNIDMKANICCVKYNPGSSNFVAVSRLPKLRFR